MVRLNVNFYFSCYLFLLFKGTFALCERVCVCVAHSMILVQIPFNPYEYLILCQQKKKRFLRYQNNYQRYFCVKSGTVT